MNCRYSRPNASTRMFYFPWAGGGASFYTAWGKNITENIEVHALCLGGRESRFQEPCSTDGMATVNWIVKTIHDKYFDKPFIFFGHSMGALLAFLAAKELKQLYNKEPAYLFLSGTTAPHSPQRASRTLNPENQTKEEFLESIKKLGGTPPELLSNPDIMEIFFPPLYADFQMIPHLKYEHNSENKPPLSCPVDFFDGSEDIDHDIDAWRQITSGPFNFQTMPGGHFFLKDPKNTENLINHINLRFDEEFDIV